MIDRERHIERTAARIDRGFGDPSPLRTYNMARGDERDADYRKWNDLPPPRWEKREPLTELVETPVGFLVIDHEDRKAA